MVAGAQVACCRPVPTHPGFHPNAPFPPPPPALLCTACIAIVAQACALYGKLDVKKTALNLIPPSFETPLPPLQPAVFPPAIREPSPPALELFDLDESFASEAVSGVAHACVVKRCRCGAQGAGTAGWQHLTGRHQVAMQGAGAVVRRTRRYCTCPRLSNSCVYTCTTHRSHAHAGRHRFSPVWPSPSPI